MVALSKHSKRKVYQLSVLLGIGYTCILAKVAKKSKEACVSLLTYWRGMKVSFPGKDGSVHQLF